MGDFNAKIGSDNQGYENVMGVHGLNRPAPQNQPDIQPAETYLPTYCNKYTREEIKKRQSHI